MADNPYDMLGPEALAVQESADADGDPAAKPRPGGGEEQKSRRSRMMHGNVLMAVLFAGAGALIYGLSFRGGPAPASAQQQQMESQVDSTILRLSTDPKLADGRRGAGRISRELLQQFYDQISQCQIPLSEMGKNPFKFVPPATAESVAPSPQGPEASGPQPAPDGEPSRAEMLARMNGLNLQAIQRGQGGKAVAIISNNLVSEGQVIEGFIVKKIGLKEVILSWQGEDHVLDMD